MSDRDIYIFSCLFFGQERHQQEANGHKDTQDKCRALEDKISQLSTQLEMSKEHGVMHNLSHHENLVAASTSDKVAASRAMQQNLTLKKQIEEIEFALIQSVSSSNLTAKKSTISRLKSKLAFSGKRQGKTNDRIGPSSNQIEEDGRFRGGIEAAIARIT